MQVRSRRSSAAAAPKLSAVSPGVTRSKTSVARTAEAAFASSVSMDEARAERAASSSVAVLARSTLAAKKKPANPTGIPRSARTAPVYPICPRRCLTANPRTASRERRESVARYREDGPDPGSCQAGHVPVGFLQFRHFGEMGPRQPPGRGSSCPGRGGFLVRSLSSCVLYLSKEKSEYAPWGEEA